MENPLLHGIQRRDTRFSEHRITCEAFHTLKLSCYAYEGHQDEILPNLVQGLGCSRLHCLSLVNACMLCCSITLRGAILVYLSNYSYSFCTCRHHYTVRGDSYKLRGYPDNDFVIWCHVRSISIANVFKVI